MGRTRRRKPKRLGRKLAAIRNALGVSQSEMARLLDLQASYTVVSSYELGTGEPDLLTLLRYAKLAKVSTDILIDDKFDLPR
jgi:transcriptional regulator with XRE-family HTH domain